MNYQSFITDLHVNLHPDQLALLEKWYEHSREVLDFFTLAYYPYEMVDFPGGMRTEGVIESTEMAAQWQVLSDFFKTKNQQDNYLSFIGYEWQGSCLDGDHNVYFKDQGPLKNPARYTQLVTELEDYDALGIPHHLAYELGHRGKNWATHNEQFSPFAEIYSSHGSSESAEAAIPMTRHIHMGPRTGGTSVYDGLQKGHHVGIIASGDNHVVPGMVNHGRAGIWAEAYTKEGIWEAFKARRVYGFTKNKITLWMDLDGQPMGSILKKNQHGHQLTVDVQGNNTIERIELIENGDLSQVFTNLGNQVKELKEHQKVTFKFKLECGWGPDLKTYPDLEDKEWQGKLTTTGEILGVEKDYNSFGSQVTQTSKSEVAFACTSHKTTQSGKWMGNSPVNTEGFIFEITADCDSQLILELNGRVTTYTVREILTATDLIVFYEESVALAKERFSFDTYFRSDPFYHNAYKARVNKGSLQADYQLNQTFEIKERVENTYYLIKVHQKDGQVAWSSPVWLEN